MRNLIVLVVLAFQLIGCSSIQRWTSSDGLSNKERRVLRAHQQKEIEDAEAALDAKKKNDMHPDMNGEEVKSIWGDPDRVEFVSNTYIWTFDNEGHPIQMAFKEGKLTAWIYDRNTENLLKAQKAQQAYHRESLRIQEEQVRSEEFRAIGSALSNIQTNNQLQRIEQNTRH